MGFTSFNPSYGLTNAQTQHVLTIVLIGGLIGLGCGFAARRMG
jgi:hypothetical protein